MIHRWRMQARLQSFMDGELSARRRAALTEHMEECPTCAAVIHRLAETDGLLTRGRPTPPPLPDAVTHAMLNHALAKAGRLPGGPHRGWPLLAWGLAAGLLIAASGAAAWWGSGGASGPQVAAGAAAPPGLVTAGSLFSGEGAPRTTGHRVSLRPQAPRRRSPADSTGELRSSPDKLRKPQGKPATPPAPSVPPGTGSGERPRRPRPPRYRLAQGATPFRCEARSAAWWDQLTEEVEASAASASALREELWVSERLECLAREQHHGSDPAPETLLGMPGEAEPTGDLLLTQSVAAAEPGAPVQEDPQPGNVVASTPLDPNALTDLPGTPAAEGPPQLLVLVTGAPESGGVIVTQCPVSTPGYARAIAARPDGCGGETWTQATVTTEPDGPRLALVMLGGNAPWWE